MNHCGCQSGTCPPIPRPRWAPDPTRHPGVSGCASVPLGTFSQCDAVFASPVLELAAEATGTMTFSFAGANFSRFRPVGLLLDVSDRGRNVVISAGAVTEALHLYEWEDLISITGVNWANVPRELNANPVPLRHYSPRHGRGMWVGFLGDLTPASPELKVTMVNECRTVANGGAGLTLAVRGALVGYALRGADTSVPPTTTTPAPGASTFPVP